MTEAHGLVLFAWYGFKWPLYLLYAHGGFVIADKLTDMFNGRLKITVIEAKGLQHTNFMTRHQPSMAVNLEPYVAIDVDEVSIERTATKSKTHEPTWNETFTTDLLRNADEVGFTVFHDATIPPDDFIANCKISLSELIEKEEQPVHELWVSQAG